MPERIQPFKSAHVFHKPPVFFKIMALTTYIDLIHSIDWFEFGFNQTNLEIECITALCNLTRENNFETYMLFNRQLNIFGI